MSLRKILVPLVGVDTDFPAIDATLLVGRTFEAHIEALYVAPIAIGNIGQVDTVKARTLFFERCAAYEIDEFEDRASGKLSANFLELHGSEADLIAEHGRLSDLIVFAKPKLKDLDWPNISIEAALRETARPVLIVSNGVARVGHRTLIGWNGSLEAARAIAFAIPILQRSSRNLIVTVGNHKVVPPAAKVTEYLKCHGIKTENMVVRTDKLSESAALLATARTYEADLIVLGAYTRHRSGRPVFGSMTEELIKQTEISVFMAH
jgi:nucleotide-binding universal stress UspA family protein